MFPPTFPQEITKERCESIFREENLYVIIHNVTVKVYQHLFIYVHFSMMVLFILPNLV